MIRKYLQSLKNFLYLWQDNKKYYFLMKKYLFFIDESLPILFDCKTIFCHRLDKNNQYLLFELTKFFRIQYTQFLT